MYLSCVSGTRASPSWSAPVRAERPWESIPVARVLRNVCEVTHGNPSSPRTFCHCFAAGVAQCFSLGWENHVMDIRGSFHFPAYEHCPPQNQAAEAQVRRLWTLCRLPERGPVPLRDDLAVDRNRLMVQVHVRPPDAQRLADADRGCREHGDNVCEIGAFTVLTDLQRGGSLFSGRGSPASHELRYGCRAVHLR